MVSIVIAIIWPIVASVALDPLGSSVILTGRAGGEEY